MNKCKKCGKAGRFHGNGVSRTGEPSFRSVCTQCVADAQRERRRAAAGLVSAVAPRGEPAPQQEPDSTWVAEELGERRSARDAKRLKQERDFLLAELESARARLGFVEQVRSEYEPAPIVVRERGSSPLREGTPVLLCSDWHVEEPVDPVKVNGLNEFNLEIADQRIDRLIDGFLWMYDSLVDRFAMRDAVLWLGGDLMTGHIHEDLAETSLLHPVETVLWLKHRIHHMIDAVLASTEVSRLIIPCSWGNHGRTTLDRRIATAAENSYEWMLYQLIAEWYKDEPRVEVLAGKSQLTYVQAYDTSLRFTHGDALTYGGGVGGLTVPLYKAVTAWDRSRRADMTSIGHWHQYTPGSRFTVNSSLIGYGPYSVHIKAAYEPPQQAFFMVDSKHGPCLHTPIWLD